MFGIRYIEQFRKLANNTCGAIALMFGLIAPALILSGVLAIDVTNLMAQRQFLQSVADGAALAAARELRLSNANSSQVAKIAQANAAINLGASDAAAIVQTNVIGNNIGVSVTISETVVSYFGRVSFLQSQQISVTSEARLAGGSPVCLLALNTTHALNLGMDSAKVKAAGCATFSNSNAQDSISATGSATISAIRICSGGGVVSPANALNPSPLLDCPAIDDPLGARPAPTVSACDYTKTSFSGGSHLLNPGTYCGGISASKFANITMSNGTYIVQDGPLKLSTGSKLTASNAGIYLTGQGAVLNFDHTTALDLSAPTSGPLSGIIFFEDRAEPVGQVHLIGSRNARNLLGTVYLPRGKLIVGEPPNSGPVSFNFNCSSNRSYLGQCPPPPASVGDLSSWTIVIANQIVMNAGVSLVLNSNYAESSVPPPTEVVMMVPLLVK